MNAPTLTPPVRHRTRPAADRARLLFARLRHRQLESALHGDVTTSARYADRATRVRRSACPGR